MLDFSQNIYFARTHTHHMLVSNPEGQNEMPEHNSPPLLNSSSCGVLLKTVNTIPFQHPFCFVFLQVTSLLAAFFGPNVQAVWCQGLGLGQVLAPALQLRTRRSGLILPGPITGYVLHPLPVGKGGKGPITMRNEVDMMKTVAWLCL